jgi:hypothetical protein
MEELQILINTIYSNAKTPKEVRSLQEDIILISRTEREKRIKELTKEG